MASNVQSKMVSRSLRRVAPFASLLALAACSGVLGIEDLHEGPRAGSSGSGNGGDGISAGGDTVSHGGGGGSNHGGTSSSAGTTTVGDAGEGGAAGAGEGGGTGGISGGGSGGSAGGGGTGGAMPGTVTGHVIDFWGHKLSGVPVLIGTALTSTDEHGAFTVPNVPGSYDVALTIDYQGDGPRNVYSWAFLGITRRDPTLQVYSGVPIQYGNIHLTLTNAATDTTKRVNVAFGGPDGSQEENNAVAELSFSTSWRGPATTQEHAHALLWQFDADELPTNYLGYDSQLVPLDNSSAQIDVKLNLAATSSIPSGNLTGTVSPANVADRTNEVFVRFNSGAAITIIGDPKGPNTFSYLVPTLAGSAITMAAIEGTNYGDTSYAVAHQDGLGAGKPATLAIPKPAKPLTPTPGAKNVDGTTAFSFLPGGGNPGPFLIRIVDQDYYQGVFIVTAGTNFKLPVVPGGNQYQFDTGHNYSWSVETHGTFANMDALLGSSGYLDEFSTGGDTPQGPNSNSGSYTSSAANGFTAK